MKTPDYIPIKFLDADPDPDVLYFEHLLSDYEKNPQEALNEPNEVTINVNQTKLAKKGIVGKAKRIGAGLFVVASAYGAYNFVQGLTSDEASQFDANVAVDETRVFIYKNTPISLATIESDISLEIDAGYDRTGPFGIDINPINNMYKVNEHLTTSTDATITVEEMEVKDTEHAVEVYLGGLIGLTKANIDWQEEDLAGADITGSSVSIGNKTKDEIDNDALEILQTSGGVAASCALRDDDIEQSLTQGVVEFLAIVSPDLLKSGKPIKVFVKDLRQQSDKIYAEKVDDLNRVIDDIRVHYDEKNDVFKVDITKITDCEEQKIKIITDKEQEQNKKTD